MSAPVHGPASVSDAIFMDEIGIEIGIHGDYRLKTAYQPIFRRDGGMLRPVAVEGLAVPFRQGRMVPTSTLFNDELSEERSFLETLCRTLNLRNHRNIGLPWLELFFSCDPVTDSDPQRWPGALDSLAHRLREIELDPAKLICVITEAASLDHAVLQEQVSEMRRLGIRIAIDDFGSGQSSFERIGLIRPDIVKIDRAWFGRLCEEDGTARLFDPIAAAFRHLGAQVFVGGIETAAQLRVAVDGGADLLQGLLLAPPALSGTIFDEAPVPVEELFARPHKVVPLPGKHQLG